MQKTVEGVRLFRGTRDYFGEDARFRNWVISAIREGFESFGFEPLETPMIENEDTLAGKYGQEGEMKRFKLLLPYSQRAGLRYDHTVPLARFVAINWNRFPLPYRRYVIGPVFRNESPGGDRLRQFTQCDFDTVGSSSPVVDAEVVALNYTVLSNLGFTDQYRIMVNDRRLLDALASSMGVFDISMRMALFRAWDKLEKMDLSKAADQLVDDLVSIEEKQSGEKYSDEERESANIRLSRVVEEQFLPSTELLMSLEGMSSDMALMQIQNAFQTDEVGEAIRHMEKLIGFINGSGVPEDRYKFSPLMARGLDYYTGPIFETYVTVQGVGSITGGGRYDKLIAQMGGPDMPASGSSFGLERLIEVMDKLALRPRTSQTTSVFVTVFDSDDIELTAATFKLAQNIRLTGLDVELYNGDALKLGKQLDIARRKKIPLVVILGPEELAQGTVQIKRLNTGQRSQLTISIDDAPSYLVSLIESSS